MRKIMCIVFLYLMFNTVVAETIIEQENIKLLNRIGYGPTKKTLDILKKKDYKSWINEQLNDQNFYDDSEIQLYLQNLSITKKTPFELFQQYDGYLNANETPSEAYPNGILYENFKKRMFYALYSENRIREMMVWFWFNHFNINARSNQASLALLNDYESKIRSMALGNFRDLLSMTMKHPAMLRYLNNVDNKSPSSIIDKKRLCAI